MALENKRWSVMGGLVALALVGCGPVSRDDYGDISGVEEIAQPLSALATPPSFATGTLTVTLAGAGELAIISKHPVSGNILVNDVATTGATSTAVKNIAVTGGAGDDTVILDFANGTFATGTSSGAGIAVVLAAGTNVFKIRGVSATGDTVSVGGTATAIDIAVNVDNYKDITVTTTGTVATTLSLGGGNDVLNALTGPYGTGGAAFAGLVTVYGGLGDDTLTGGDGNDTFYGDLGNDLLNGGSKVDDGDVYNGGGGTDTVTYAARTLALDVTVGAGADDGDTASSETDAIASDVEVVRGGSGADTFTGYTGNETFYGGAGNDTFLMGLIGTTGAGNDTVYGEAGTDTVSYATRLAVVTATMDSNAANDGEPSLETDTIRDDVENFICPTAAVVCTVTGNALDNSITGGAGADVLSGGAGDDTFVMGANGTIGAGADAVTGGAGVDTITFDAFGAVINVIMDGTASTTMSKVINSDVENLTCPSASACTVVANSGANRIVGSSALDTINAAGGDDFIETVAGNDAVTCGDGSDIVYTAAGTPTFPASDCEL